MSELILEQKPSRRLWVFAAAVALATPGDINYFGAEDLAAFEADMTGRLVR